MAAGLLAMMSIAISFALLIATNHAHFLGAEKQWLEAFHQTELKMIEIEDCLLHGIQSKGDETIQIEEFKPKYFKNRAGIETRHYRIQIRQAPYNLRLRSTIRIDQTLSPKQGSKSKSMPIQPSMQRIHWEILHE